MAQKEPPGSASTYEYTLGHKIDSDGRKRCIRMLFYGQGPLQIQDSILKALQTHGLMKTSDYGDDAIGFGLVFFETPDDALWT